MVPGVCLGQIVPPLLSRKCSKQPKMDRKCQKIAFGNVRNNLPWPNIKSNWCQKTSSFQVEWPFAFIAFRSSCSFLALWDVDLKDHGQIMVTRDALFHPYSQFPVTSISLSILEKSGREKNFHPFSREKKFEEGAEPKTKYVRNNFLILENSREISLLDLDLEVFSFHCHFSISISSHFYFTFISRSRSKVIFFSLLLLERGEWDFFFTFHFSIVQNPLSQDTAGKCTLTYWRI